MARAVVRVTWKNDVTPNSINIKETRRILTGVNQRGQQETGPFHLVGASFYETSFDQTEPTLPAIVGAFQDMLAHFLNPLPNGNPRAQVQTVSVTLWNIVPDAGPDEAEEGPQVEVEPQDLSDIGGSASSAE